MPPPRSSSEDEFPGGLCRAILFFGSRSFFFLSSFEEEGREKESEELGTRVSERAKPFLSLYFFEPRAESATLPLTSLTLAPPAIAVLTADASLIQRVGGIPSREQRGRCSLWVFRSCSGQQRIELRRTQKTFLGQNSQAPFCLPSAPKIPPRRRSFRVGCQLGGGQGAVWELGERWRERERLIAQRCTNMEKRRR